MNTAEPNTKRPNWYPPWAPRFWNGMRPIDYFNLIRENRFKVSPLRFPMLGLVGCCTLANSVLGTLQSLTHGKKIEQSELVAPPVFIIGHWRSGTTMLHELMSMDEQLAYPTNFDSFLPHHLLISRWLMYPIINTLLPGKRPMDNMSIAAGSPQEDDFALCALGGPTPYRRIAFPNQRGSDHLQLNASRATPEQLDSLKKNLGRFYQMLTIQYRKRLLLKSPPHTGRIHKLAQWFPGAKFVHVSRHPYRLVPSTMHLWRSLDITQGLQVASYDDVWLKNYVFECQDLMYQAYFDERPALEKNQLVEVKFEELVKSPVDQIQRIYQQLELPVSEEMQSRVEQYFQDRRDHKKNRLSLDEKLRLEIDQHWQGYMKAFDYQPQSS